ncbi:MAG: SDR family oxidoreductase [Pseudomarimonas sp.]
MTAAKPANQQPIAIVGVSALFPGSTDAGGFWRDILDGRDLITDVPPSHWLIDDYFDADPSAPDKTYARRGGFLDPVGFDSLGFGVPPSTLPATDTAQLLALILAQSVLQDAAGAQFESMDRSRISVILGVTSAQELLFSMVSRLQKPVWVKALRESGLPEDEVQAACTRIADHYVPWQESSFPGLLGNVVAGRIANRLNLGGTNCVTDAACASALSALSMAISELQLGNSDLVISGGVDTLNDIFMYMCFSKTPALSPTGDCRPFSDSADGTMLGEGLGMVALKRLDDAERDGDRIYAVIRGLGSSSDGRSKSVYAPVSEGQAQALRRAYAIAGYSAATIELVEAHGTGTKAGDVAEFEGLRQVFADADGERRQWCALGSVKSQIGHTKAAAGAAGLFKAVMALHHKVLPPTIKIDAPNPKLAIEQSPFYLNTRARPWIRDGKHPRRAAVSAFGFGGSNFHVTLEEYAGSGTCAERLPTHSHELILLSANDVPALIAAAETLLASTDPLAQRAGRWQTQFASSARCRLAIVASDIEQLKTRLRGAITRIQADHTLPFTLPDGSSYGVGATSGTLALLFPGQGSQYVDMGADLAMQFPQARGVWDRAADLPFDPETSLQQRVFPRPTFAVEAAQADADALTATEWAQPAIGATSVSMLALLNQCGIEAHMFAGHSFGEVVALHAAGVLSESAMLRVARRRGELMAQAAATPGAMTALTLPLAEVQALLSCAGSTVVIANHNAPKQVVVSGTLQAISEFESQLATQGIAFRRLPVASGFHSDVVAGACAPFAEFLAEIEFAPARAQVFANATATVHGHHAQAIRDAVAAQVAQPVRFVEMIEAMYAAGARTFLEVGPGNVLSGLVSAILGERPFTAISMDRKHKPGVESLLLALGRLAANGIELDVSQLFAGLREATCAATHGRPLTPINGSNVGKPYPPAGGSAALPRPNPPRSTQPIAVVAATPVSATPPCKPLYPLNSASTIDPPVTSAAPTALHPTPPVPQGSPNSQWLAAFQSSQQQLADTHASFQRAMFESHASFLQLSETALTGLAALAGGAAMTQHVLPTPLSCPAVPMTAAPRPIAVTSAVRETVSTNGHTAEAPKRELQSPTPGAHLDTSVRTDSWASGVSTPSTSVAVIDLTALMLQVVAEKTGYPVDMLNLDMDLEGDLGIDSIKRVEILAAVDERAPGLATLDRSAMSALHTLAEIVDYLQGSQGSTAATAAPATQNKIAVPAAVALAFDLTTLMLNVVAEKTGYPVDMLNLDMDLEGDLGIDSIKRVEILAAVAERAPGLPTLDRGAMSALHTLAEIVAYLQGSQAAAPVEIVSTNPTVIAAAPNVDLTALMLQVVAEKTGYPVEMLTLDMDLEADLGIDSIKRVEILAAVDERAPGLPTLDRGAMSALHTLAEIVTYLSGATAHTSTAVEPVEPVEVAVVTTPATSKPSPVPLTESEPAPSRLGRYRLQRIPAPATGMAQSGLFEGHPVCVLGHALIGAALAAELDARGVKAEYVTELPPAANRCVYLGGLRDIECDDQAVAINREAFAVARQLASQLDAHASARDARGAGLFVSVQDTGGTFGLSAMDPRRAWLSGLPALIKTAALEWPRAALKAIDIESDGRAASELARVIADELLAGGGEIEVMLPASGQRETLCSVAEPIAHGSAVVGSGDVVVVSGGARGVTAACITEWAADSGARFVLLGRSPLRDEPAACNGITTEAELKRILLASAREQGQSLTPAELLARVREVQAGREIRATLAAIHDAGGSARYDAVDVADRVALQQVLADVRATWGPIAGLVHAAGVLADKRIIDKTNAMFDQVFDTKVAGLRALLDVTQSDPLRLLAVFSSVSARCGNTGQADYAMANEVLAKVMVAEQRRRPHVVTKSFGWGPWEAGMVTPHLRDRFAALGVPMIPLNVGARMFADELVGSARDQVELVLGGEPRAEALLFEGASARVQCLEISVARDSHGYLEGHAIHGQPVLPLVLAAEWMSRAARSFRPGLPLAALHELKVLKGIRLGGFENGGDRFTIEATALPSDRGAQLQMRILDRRGHPNYSARIELLPETQGHPQNNAALSLEPWGDQPIYADLLFHRGAFELIDQLDGISDHGIEGTLRGVADGGWSVEPWQLDVAALDAGLQLAVLFGQRMLGGPNLPTGIDQIRAFGLPPGEGLLSATAYRRALSTHAMTTDIVFTDARGQRVAEMIGVHNHAVGG